MANAYFKCSKCADVELMSFTPGKANDCVCPKCGGLMERVHTPNVALGSVVTDKMIKIDHEMLYAQTDNKKDKNFI